ncbi:MAG: bifunctional DNA-formamidopyrimidine glycosylase/DNA-(apurinic or apyrimidinic site) lyase [Clostridia bacterium]|nr:bifunctional DNA-formamidopyrimidine glycosylase/DNA-(apurinic or apyrimidinic site) lyase [Clostridia bacterium]
MPELPEVETIRRVLGPQLAGRTIERVTVLHPGVVAAPEAAALADRLRGQRFSDLGRRGKFLLPTLESGDRLLLHLRMTGALLLAPAALPPEPHTHLVWQLDDGRELRFSDPRRFGRLWLWPAGEPCPADGLTRLGPEPDDPALTAAAFAARLSGSRRAIKACLLDQTVVAGIGNIYSDEILHAAALHPARPASSLTAPDWERLAASIPERIRWFTEQNAISPEDYLKGRGWDYRNTPHFAVYGRAGQPCPRCGAPLARATVAGRGSCFCPGCQQGEGTESTGRALGG